MNKFIILHFRSFLNYEISFYLNQISTISSSGTKVFGGGDVIDVKENVFRIGARNIDVAMDVLNERRIKIVAQSVGGKRGRKIYLNTTNGCVIMRYV